MAATAVALRDNGIPPLLGDPRENPAFGLRDSDWDMRRRIGGALLTVEDGSLNRVPCGSRAVEFFSTGRTGNGTC